MKKEKLFWVEAVFAVATLIVILHAKFRSRDAFLIFTTYLVVVIVFSVLLTWYWVTNRKRNRDRTRISITYFVNNLGMPTLAWNDSLQFIYANPILCDLLGLERDTLLTKDILPSMFGTEDITWENLKSVLHAESQETHLRAKDGREVVMLWTTSGFQQTEHECYYLSVGIDVTELHSMQKTLREYSTQLAASESRYAMAMELAEIGMIMAVEAEQSYFISKELQAMLGIDTALVPFTEFAHLVHPNDRVMYETYIRGNVKHVISETQNLELRIRLANGEYHWFSYRCQECTTDGSKPQIGALLIDIDKEKEKDALIEHLAYVDDVTGIPNRNKLMLMGQELYTCSKELNVNYWVMVLDIDRFHLVNDTCGYENGNKILRDFAHILYKYLTFGGFGARISGDNYALIIRDYGDEELPLKTMERIQMDLAELARDYFPAKALTCSAGFSQMPQDGDCFADVLEHAEFALSSCATRKGNVLGYSSGMHDTIVSESELEKRLSDAIDNGELGLYYQPKISLANGRIVGVEALIRWIRPDGTILQPGSFVPIAETSHLISRISHFVLTEACEQNRIWQKMGLPNIVMSINLTSTDFYQGNVREIVYEALARTGLDPQWLEVELTESLAIKDIDLAVEQMNQLRSMGVKLAMDDFGTGYSSLSYIQLLPITLLKLDRSFIIDLEHDEIAREIVSAVIRIAKSKHIETIAEGIENPEQARLLREAGCDNAQGYLYGKPMPPKEIEEYMRRNITERIIY